MLVCLDMKSCLGELVLEMLHVLLHVGFSHAKTQANCMEP
jgi:hypothetical protein